MEKAVLISVSDRTGLVPFARELKSLGYTLLATSGSGKALADDGIETLAIEKYTGQAEILDGRVKTLHPKIHAGLLARRDSAEHMAEIKKAGILPIEVAVVNLYPFVSGVRSEKGGDPKQMVELCDVGGPTMIRAAAKNFAGVFAVIDPADYPLVIAALKNGSLDSNEAKELRRYLAVKVFTQTAAYDLEIAKYFSNVTTVEGKLSLASGLDNSTPGVTGCVLEKQFELRYGENPHQKGGFYRQVGAKPASWQKLGGKDLSYNNLLDFNAALALLRSFKNNKPFAGIIKHLNPCGAACAETPLEALRLAKRCDPRSHFGGIIVFNKPVALEVATEVREDFAEIVVAPDFAPDALELLTKNKNLRIIKVDYDSQAGTELRAVEGGFLIQEPDLKVSNTINAENVTPRKLSTNEIKDLDFAWTICAHVKSNAIVIVRDQMILGVGAGQMSRIDSTELAISKALAHEHSLAGAVAASDAFFPFTDSLEHLAEQGVCAVIAPKGAKRDEEVAARARELGLSLLFASDRHFRH